MSERIGIYICECGPNMAQAIDINELVDFTKKLPPVSFAKSYPLLCSEQGRDFLKKDIKRYKLTRLVIAGCSPKEHEHTFRKVVKSAGLNPYLLQIANIREQCAWVIKDKKTATKKAKVIIQAAVNRVLFHEPLKIKQIKMHADVLVVGAGVAGINAALTLAQKKRKVYLVEKLPFIGGKAALYEEVFPTLECASCMLDQQMDQVMHHENIELLTSSQVRELLGFYGNFIANINVQARCVDKNTCIGCGSCSQVCPVEVDNEYNQNLNKRKAIYIPYAGALPNTAVIDKDNCLHFKDGTCGACKDACPFSCIDYDQKDQLKQAKVGAVVLATGFEMFDITAASQYGYKKVKNIYTSLEFERILSATGPTEGKVLTRDQSPPKSIAFIHCAGSRTEKYNDYCPGICCLYSLKQAHLVKKQLPQTKVCLVYADFCLPGKYAQEFFNKITQENHIDFIHMKTPNSIGISSSEDEKVLVKCTGVNNEKISEKFDMAVLAVSIQGIKNSADTAEKFDISPVNNREFFIEEHTLLAPASTTTEGIYIAGCAQGPKNIQESVLQAQAASGKILSRLVIGEKLELDPVIAVINDKLCSGCKICIGLCPYHAISYNKKKKQAEISEVLCRGCGICVAACPSSAIKGEYFSDKQINAEIKGNLDG